jgi:predicted dehydrogenase
MAEKRISAATTKSTSINRRKFIAGASAAAVSFSVIKPELVRGAEANSKIKLGLIGCGGRGKWIANLFNANGNYEIVAAADYFQDRVDAFGNKFNVPKAKRYTGLSCYKKLLEQKVDAVAIISPPYFHPDQAAAAVDAGVHTYVAKPIAVDVPGCLSIEQSGKNAAAKKLCFLVDFQTRANALYVEAIRRVHNGDLGKLCFGESSYLTGRLGMQAQPGSAEARLRNWVFDKALSGDIITEQNIHTLDVASWIMNTTPIHASGTGGRKSRTDVGDCWDHFSISFVYPDNVGVTFCSKQCKGYGSQGGIRNRMFGTKGTLETEYGGNVLIRGEGDKFYRGGRTAQIYQEGAVNNIADFHKDITGGNYANSTVGPSVRSNLVTVLGRTAAYTGDRVYWDKMLKSTDKIDGRLQGLKA